MNITFKMRARLILMGKLREIKGTPEDDGRLLARSIIKKIRITEEESVQFEKPTDAGVMVNLAQVDRMPDLQAEVNSNEIQKLINIIKNGSWGPEDDDWFEPLLEQLQTAHKEAKAAKKGQTN